MKAIRGLLAVGLAGGLSLAAMCARANLEVSAAVQIHSQTDFYAPLATHGEWVEVHSYGRCWRPQHVAASWRPYCEGQWVWTDCGWYWESAEPWGWACYHYGYWIWDADYGWVWEPGLEWAPAWVSWRVGGGYIGWAPMPPPGFLFTHRPASAWYVFVGATRFGGPVQHSTVVVDNTSILKHTTVINNITRENRTFEGGRSQTVFVNQGPAADVVEKATGKKLQQEPIRQVVQRTAAPAHFAPNGAGNQRPVAPNERPAMAPAIYNPGSLRLPGPRRERFRSAKEKRVKAEGGKRNKMAVKKTGHE